MSDEDDIIEEALGEGADVKEEDPWTAAMEEQEGFENAESPPMSELVDDAGLNSFDNDNPDLEVILDIPVNISMVVGTTPISIRNLLQLNQGSVIELDRMAGEPLDVLVNNTLIAHGEVVVVNEKFGIRLTDVISAAERIRRLG
ncbi:MAG: flagellar motor switch protein FliN/FliY [Candidatus Azotimanducaceae bacterium]|jgi:flagellar motor switch protein FliN/FliY